MILAVLQHEHLQWVEHNFPYQKPHQPLLGLTEEVGELCHAHLKAEQAIREFTDKGLGSEAWRERAEDAVGDIVIYLASYCNSVGLDLDHSVEKTWEKVSQRNWAQFPADGGEEPNAGFPPQGDL